MVIVAAIDDVDSSTRILEEAWKLAESFGEPLHVIFVYQRSEHSHLANQVLDIAKPISEEQADKLAEEVVFRAVDGITEEYEAVGRVGDAAEEILDYVDTIGAEYIVIGGRSHSPVGKALFGSVTQSVLLDSSCPVLAVMTEE